MDNALLELDGLLTSWAQKINARDDMGATQVLAVRVSEKRDVAAGVVVVLLQERGGPTTDATALVDATMLGALHILGQGRI